MQRRKFIDSKAGLVVACITALATMHMPASAADKDQALVGCQYDDFKTKVKYFSRVVELNVFLSRVIDKNTEAFKQYLIKEHGLPASIYVSPCAYTFLNAQVRPVNAQFELNKSSAPRQGYTVVETNFRPFQVD